MVCCTSIRICRGIKTSRLMTCHDSTIFSSGAPSLSIPMLLSSSIFGIRRLYISTMSIVSRSTSLALSFVVVKYHSGRPAAIVILLFNHLVVRLHLAVLVVMSSDMFVASPRFIDFEQRRWRRLPMGSRKDEVVNHSVMYLLCSTCVRCGEEEAGATRVIFGEGTTESTPV